MGATAGYFSVMTVMTHCAHMSVKLEQVLVQKVQSVDIVQREYESHWFHSPALSRQRKHADFIQGISAYSLESESTRKHTQCIKEYIPEHDQVKVIV